MIKDLLTSLKMPGAIAVLEELNKFSNRDEYLTALLNAELKDREQRAALRRLKEAKFPVEKDWHDIDKNLNPSIPFSEIESIDSAYLIAQKKNVCFMGQQGTGKTHSLIALGRQLCKKGISVKFTTACQLVNSLEEAKANHKLSKAMLKITKPQLLVIDELGFVPFSDCGARLLFDVFATRYERGSIAVSTNLSFDKWIQIFGTKELTAALIDRFTHKCIIYTYEGQSVRLIAAKKENRRIRTLNKE